MGRANEGLELRPAMRHLQTREPAFDGAGTIHLNCPRCGLTITPKASWLTIEHCPRCIARNGLAVSLFASTLPTDELYPPKRHPAPTGPTHRQPLTPGLSDALVTPLDEFAPCAGPRWLSTRSRQTSPFPLGARVSLDLRAQELGAAGR